jgi:lipopolysaccharide biosynthesis glycosyltransferase
MDIVTNLDTNYAPHAAAMLTSLRQANRSEAINIYLLHGGLNEHVGAVLKRYLEAIVNSVSFVRVDQNIADCLPVVGYYSRATFFRLFLASYLPPDLDKVLYLDPDVIVLHSLCELWDTDLAEYPMAAVAEPKMSRHLARLKLPQQSKYFNSGVALINLPLWRSCDISIKALEYLRTHRDNQIRLKLLDQDVLNVLLHQNWLELPHAYNVTSKIFRYPDRFAEEQEDARNPHIVHFTGGGDCKPWMYGCKHAYRTSYLEAKKQTPWADSDLENDTRLRTRLRRLVRHASYGSMSIMASGACASA